MEKLRVGVIFGGGSREREVSFAGGRTVYDNLNKSIFEPIPLFVDSFGNFILLTWEFIYKGSIRDFYPPAESIPPSVHEFQIYAESLGDLDKQEQQLLSNRIGSRVEPTALTGLIDIAFLCLHGTDGEDGRIQGLLEYLRIPYTGSGILSSAVGMNKAVQKELMKAAGFDTPAYKVISRREWMESDKEVVFRRVQEATGFPFVVKAANQGSSIGLGLVQQNDLPTFVKQVNKAFFIREIGNAEWNGMDFRAKVAWVRETCDIREGLGLPLMIGSRMIYHPEELLSVLLDLLSEPDEQLLLIARDGESEVLAEAFIRGKEFSCIVLEDTSGHPLALPPTEIRKGAEVFDYRAKYLPGLSRKITPIRLPDDHINAIRSACQKLFDALHFKVYARIDGFITDEGKIFLNDPNTTSGMMPSSFFFHQAAEIGMNPSQFITCILHTSLRNRINDLRWYGRNERLLQRLEQLMERSRSSESKRIRAAVILGGYSSERHISVESGRNIYEKLSSGDKYDPVPVFLTGSQDKHRLYTIPVNVLLKDNADDIREKVDHYEVHPVVKQIIEEGGELTRKYADVRNLQSPVPLSYEDLARQFDVVFIALHGRPGEDGSLQKELEKVGLPYNGSGPSSSEITIDKYRTNEILAAAGFRVAMHYLGHEFDWLADPVQFLDQISATFPFPFIAKPVDDGCSSAVKIIRSREELEAYTKLVFRARPELDEQLAAVLKIKPREEFPVKNTILFEELIDAKGANRFLEVTGGMLTSLNEKGELEYEVFEASEALSEGDVLSLEEKFLAGQGQNITPARYSAVPAENKQISTRVKEELGKAARLLKIEGYARIDAFVRIYSPENVEVIFIEVNSLPGMTPATCIFHQAALAHYRPYEFIDKILDFGMKRKKKIGVS